jgi:hypothetical protein
MKKYTILLYSKTYLLNKKQFKKAIKNKVNKQLLKEKKFIEILEIHKYKSWKKMKLLMKILM